MDVGVEAPAPDDVAAGRRHGDAAEAREQRPGEQERRADLARELGVEARSCRRRVGRRAPRSGRSTRRRRRGRRGARPSSRRRGCAARSRAAPRSEARMLAARIGSAAFLLPAARTVPLERAAAFDDEGLHGARNRRGRVPCDPPDGRASGEVLDRQASGCRRLARSRGSARRTRARPRATRRRSRPCGSRDPRPRRAGTRAGSPRSRERLDDQLGLRRAGRSRRRRPGGRASASRSGRRS